MASGRERLDELAGLDRLGVEVEGPPWILGRRGLPLEAPENTLASFERALEAGLDGLDLDVRAAAGGEPVVLRDARLERTTDGEGAVAARSLPELFQLDAGGWFSRDFAGEPVPHLDEVLELEPGPGRVPVHLLEIHDAGLVPELALRLREPHAPRTVRVASRRRDLCVELSEAGLDALLLAPRAEHEVLAFARDARLAGVGVTTAAGWATGAAGEAWPLERWALGADEAEEQYALLRGGLTGLASCEGRRALAVRALTRLAREGQDAYPLAAEPLLVSSAPAEGPGGDWTGEWAPRVRVANPFPFASRALVRAFVRRGAFESEGLPVALELAPGEESAVDFGLRGGSWSPGGDPLVAALFAWDAGPGRPAGRLLLDLTLRRERRVRADAITQRVEMLRESPGVSRATMTLRRRGGALRVAVEDPGGLRDPRVSVSLDGELWHGGATLQVPLPERFDGAPGGVPFSCGFHGLPAAGGPPVLRRWAGGLPDDPRSGGPGRLLPRRRA